MISGRAVRDPSPEQNWPQSSAAHRPLSSSAFRRQLEVEAERVSQQRRAVFGELRKHMRSARVLVGAAALAICSGFLSPQPRIRAVRHEQRPAAAAVGSSCLHRRHHGRGTARGSSASDYETGDVELERRVVELEAKLARAVSDERYDDATESRNQLFRLQMDDASSVLAVNADFYKAFSKKVGGWMNG